METASGYDASMMNSLLYLDVAEKRFVERDGPALRSGALQDLFMKHDLVNILGLLLLHKHFDLSGNEALVDYNDTAMPWDLKDVKRSSSGVMEKHKGYIKPRSWLVSTKTHQLVPTEFYFQHPASPASTYDQRPLVNMTPEFVQEFAQVLEKNNLTDVLGLCLLKSPFVKQLETTEGRANIAISMSDEDFASQTDSIDAIWYYTRENGVSPDGTIGPFVTFQCSYACVKSDQGTHVSGHYNI